MTLRETLVNRCKEADRYARTAREHIGAFAVVLPGEARPFWSKGWRGCVFNCGKPVNDWHVKMVERITIHRGTITRGFYCR